MDSIDATRTHTKEAPKRRRPTMEEIKRLEKKCVAPSDGTTKYKLRKLKYLHWNDRWR